MKEIDYSKYSVDELYDVEHNIDKESYPERYQAVLNELEKRTRKDVPKFSLETKAVSKFDYSVDPISRKTRWIPTKSGGANFPTHYLAEVNPSRIEFKTSPAALVFSIFFIVISVGFLYGAINQVGSFDDLDNNLGFVLSIVTSVLFVFAGIYFLHAFTVPIIFDKSLGMYWKSRKLPSGIVGNRLSKKSIELNNIHAIQLISESVNGQGGYFISYEINLVLKNGDRMNVVDHGDYRDIRNDALKLSRFLNCPVWDAIDDSLI